MASPSWCAKSCHALIRSCGASVVGAIGLHAEHYGRKQSSSVAIVSVAVVQLCGHDATRTRHDKMSEANSISWLTTTGYKIRQPMLRSRRLGCSGCPKVARDDSGKAACGVRKRPPPGPSVCDAPFPLSQGLSPSLSAFAVPSPNLSCGLAVPFLLSRSCVIPQAFDLIPPGVPALH